jgi:DNA polymerase-3 subunit epsilon
MGEMVGIAEEVVGLPCPTTLEAEVRELRLIADYKPRYNRRSRFPEKSSYLKLTLEPFPRLSIVRQVKDDGTTYLGPFSSNRRADAAATALLEAFPLRQCTRRLARTGGGTACLLAEMSRCGAPCEQLETIEEYAVHVDNARRAMTTDARPVIEAVLRRIAPVSASQRFEEAATHRDRLQSFLAAARRAQRLWGLGRCPEVVAARPDGAGGWEIAVIRYGRLAASGRAVRGVPVVPFADSLVAGAEPVPRGVGGFPAATSEETECLLRWLDGERVRLVSLEGTWCSPLHGAGGLQSPKVQPAVEDHR